MITTAPIKPSIPTLNFDTWLKDLKNLSIAYNNKVSVGSALGAYSILFTIEEYLRDSASEIHAAARMQKYQAMMEIEELYLADTKNDLVKFEVKNTENGSIE